jgi:hypothetical protein
MFQWSIGIYTGPDPLHLFPSDHSLNPALTADHVTDVRAKYIADPFMIREGSRWFMFFEVLTGDDRGEIGLATSADGRQWNYERIVLREPFHLSYPYVFKWRDTIYMIPETRRAEAVRLYRAVRFPFEWRLERELLQGAFVDSSAVRFDETWWLFVGEDGGRLHLFYADELEGPWTAHPQSPVIRGSVRKARPGGRVLATNNGAIRFAQDAIPFYGTRVRGFLIDQLSRTHYREREVSADPIVGASMTGWNGFGMHHIDAHQDGDRWLACVDGCTIPRSSLRRILPQTSNFKLCVLTDTASGSGPDGFESATASNKELRSRGIDPQSVSTHVLRVHYGDHQGIRLGRTSHLGTTVHDILIDPQDRFLLDSVELLLWALDSGLNFDMFHATSGRLHQCCLAVMERNGERPIVAC